MAEPTKMMVLETTLTTGTGPILLEGRENLFRAFRDAYSDGDTIHYIVKGPQVDDRWEWIEGNLSVGTGAGGKDELLIGTVRKSWDAGTEGTAKLSWGSGAKDVYAITPEGTFPEVANEGSEYTPATFRANIGAAALTDMDAFKKGCQASRTSAQTIPNDVNTAILWNGENWDNGGFHSLVSNTDRLTVPDTGNYLFVAWISLSSANEDTANHFTLRKNAGATTIGSHTHIPKNIFGANAVVMSFMVALSAGDYVKLWLHHDGSSSEDVNSGSTLTVQRLLG